MILYFSGTGNSEYAAKRIGKTIKDEVLNLFEKIRSNDLSELHSDRPWIIVTPTYAWRIPHIVEEWLKNAVFTGSRDFYFVMTCGGNIGNAGSYLKELCVKKNWNYLGCAEIVMPENYIAMFPTPTLDAALETIRQADEVIGHTAHLILNGEPFPQSVPAVADKLSSGIVNTIFYPLFVRDKKFCATDNCISCGKCAALCPLDNIRLKDGRPVWNGRCTHCMACISHCPKEAIEYGRRSKGKPRYTCPKKGL